MKNPKHLDKIMQCMKCMYNIGGHKVIIDIILILKIGHYVFPTSVGVDKFYDDLFIMYNNFCFMFETLL